MLATRPEGVFMATILITGSSTGIGFATALVLVRAGHDVFATMRDPDRSPELKSIAARESLPIAILRLDVDSDDSVGQAFSQVMAERDHLDVLINNAGACTFGAVEDLPLQVFRRTMETNYFGALRCIKAVVPAMRKRRSGCIINVTSVAGRIGTGAESSYVASKFALEALSEALAGELKTFNVRVAIVEPGIVETPIFAKLTEDPPDSPYPQERRLRALCAAALRNPVSPFVVAEEIRRIVESHGWQLRYPTPEALPLLQWRASMTDEQWVEYNSIPKDEEWYARIERDFGLDARPFRQVQSVVRGV
jgi:NAD(P)-dependent dehydrogenase (short-subunit alcohol dehydrogenase family)